MNSAHDYAASVTLGRAVPDGRPEVAASKPLFQQLREQQETLLKLVGDCVELASVLEGNLVGALPPPGHDLSMPSGLKSEINGGLHVQLGVLFNASQSAAITRAILQRLTIQL